MRLICRCRAGIKTQLCKPDPFPASSLTLFPRRGDQDAVVWLISRQSANDYRLTATEILSKIKRAYRIDEKRLLRREDQAAFKAWVYLLRRAANLPLAEVARRCGVSPSRVSHIQRIIEGGTLDGNLRRLLLECNVKN